MDGFHDPAWIRVNEEKKENSSAIYPEMVSSIIYFHYFSFIFPGVLEIQTVPTTLITIYNKVCGDIFRWVRSGHRRAIVLGSLLQQGNEPQ